MSQNNVNRLVLIMEKCVLREVGTELTNRFIMTGVFAGHSPWWSGFDTRPFHLAFLVEKLALGQVGVRVLRFRCQYHCRNAPYNTSSLLTKGQTGKAWRPSKITGVLSEVEEHWGRKSSYITCFLWGRGDGALRLRISVNAVRRLKETFVY
jgi:hypothetical protein